MDEKRNAFLEQLYREHYESVFRYCAFYVNNSLQHKQLIEDSIQDAFVKAVIHYDEIKDYQNPVGWIAIAARNQIKDSMRKKVNQEKVVASYDYLKSEDASFSYMPHEEILRKQEFLECLNDIYSELTDMEKVVFSVC